MCKDSTLAETWLAIPGYEGVYEVSSEGRVRSLPRIDCRGNSISGQLRRAYPRDPRGYLSLSLWKDGCGCAHYVHRLVMLAFVGEPPSGHEVHHLNGDTSDNRVANLSYVKSNSHRSDHNKGEHNFSAKLSEADVIRIRALYASRKYLQRTIAQMYGVHRQYISTIVRYRIWKNTP